MENLFCEKKVFRIRIILKMYFNCGSRNSRKHQVGGNEWESVLVQLIFPLRTQPQLSSRLPVLSNFGIAIGSAGDERGGGYDFSVP